MPQGHRVVPQLHDDGARHRARAAAPRRRHRPHGRVDVPVGVGRRAGRACTSSTSSGRSSTARRGSLRAGRRPCRRRSSRARCGTKPIAGNVIPLAGSVKEAGLHVARSGRWSARRRKILHDDRLRVHRHLRARAGVRRPRDDRQRAVPRGRSTQGRGGRAAARRARRAARRRRRRLPHAARGAPASTRCSSAGCARTRRRPDTLDLWVTGDNLRKGAALNAVQMAELLLV